jgi:hypothetical protein
VRAAFFTCALLLASSAFAATAYFTGRQEYVTTVTGQMAIKCQYEYLGQKFWKVFKASTCPLSIEVE